MDPLRMLGWREWAALPALGIETIRVKVDTGARTSALQAVDRQEFQHRGRPWIRFQAMPDQESDLRVACQAPLVDQRWIKDSGGHATHRPIIETTIRLGDQTFPIEVSLADRADLGFRMLLGRTALQGRYAVDPWASDLAGTGLSVDFGTFASD